MHAIEALLDADGADWRETVDRAVSSTIPPADTRHACGHPRRARRHAPHRWLAVAASVAIVAVAAIAATVFVGSGHREAAHGGTTTGPLPPRAGYMRVVASNGRVGYARDGDVREPTPHNPHQALLWQHNRGDFGTVVPVYDDDDQVIGTFDTGSRATTSCPDQNGIGFAVSPPSSSHGQATPARAASAIYRWYGFSHYNKAPSQPWRVTRLTPSAAIVTAGELTFDVERLDNGTWIAHSGQRCRTPR
jgi:hypothetical protein